MNKIFAAVFSLLFFLADQCAAYAPAGNLYVTMLDIGQGDAFLIETPVQNILLDTGPVDARARLVNLLQDAGIDRLERVILTHPHADHIGGVKAVLENFTVDEIIDNGFTSRSPLYRAYRNADVKFSAVKAGDVLDLGGGVKFKVLAPIPLVSFNLNTNCQSVVGKLSFGDFSILFTGDAEADLENFLPADDLKSTILKAGHHGSKTSSSPDFVANVRPEYIFISAGRKNSYGHPHKVTLATFRESFILPDNIFCTAFNGSVRVETDGFNKIIIPEFAADWIEDYSGEIISVTRLD